MVVLTVMDAPLYLLVLPGRLYYGEAARDHQRGELINIAAVQCANKRTYCRDIHQIQSTSPIGSVYQSFHHATTQATREISRSNLASFCSDDPSMIMSNQMHKKFRTIVQRRKIREIYQSCLLHLTLMQVGSWIRLAS